MTAYHKFWLAAQHPLLAPLVLLAIVVGVDFSKHDHSGGGPAWMEIHVPVFSVGACIILCVWLIARYERRTLRIIEDSFDEVRRDQRIRIQSLEKSRDLQIEYNSHTREELQQIRDSVNALEQIPLIHAARQRGGT